MSTLTRNAYLNRKASALCAEFTNEEDVLEHVVFRTSDGRYRVEFLLEFQGPTTWIIVDSRYGASIESTDGPDGKVSYDMVSWSISDDVASPFIELAEMLASDE